VNSEGNQPITLHLPEEISRIVRKGAFPEDLANPLVCIEFADGAESLFDTRKGLFLNPPAGVTLPSREALKAFGKMIEGFRLAVGKRRTSEPRFEGSEQPVERFEVCC
jgi:hypothetical protein